MHPSFSKFAVWFVSCWLLLNSIKEPNSLAQETSYLETWALAENRAEVLEQLVPGTEDFYFYHCLHYQQTEQLKKVDELLELWIKRFNYSPKVQQIRTRQALLKYGEDPNVTLAFLQQHLNLNLNHQRETPTTQRDLPTTLDQALISVETQTATALKNFLNTDGFSYEGMARLATAELSSVQLRHLLSRIEFPDFPNLVELIARELKERDALTFGQFRIHNSLTLKQLDELAKKVPSLGAQTQFVNIYLTKLAPRDDVNWQTDQEAHKKYLDRLWNFVKDLPPSHNSLKANILFRKLDLALRIGEYDRALFLTYLQLPRSVAYIHPLLLKQVSERTHVVNLNQDFREQTRLAPINIDEPLVQTYLQHFLKDAEDTSEFEPFIETEYLQRQFAVVKILNGLGDNERWASLLPPAEYQPLIERVDLDFATSNPENFGVNEEVKLELHTKNIKTLIVKIFEINTENYYREHGSEIDTNINLDGLVPNHEKSFSYNDAPALRIKREFVLPEVNRRGVYVVDFIAGGKSSRALVRIGRLQMIQQATAAGQCFTVLNQDGALVSDARLSISGRRFTADKEGRIFVPFSNTGGTSHAIISQGDFSCLQTFKPATEKYELTAAMVVDRESLIPSNTAKVLIRPQVRIHDGEAVPLKLLKETQLIITTTNRDGIVAEKVIDDLEFDASEETLCEFVVPPRLKKLSLFLNAKIENLSQSKTDILSVRQVFKMNEIDNTTAIEELHFAPTATGFVIEVRGKSGEPRVKQPIQLSLQLLSFKEPIRVNLQSDAAGQLKLGELHNVVSVSASLVSGTKKVWSLQNQTVMYPKSLNGLTSEDIAIPAPADLYELDRSRVALFEKRSGTIVADWFDAVTLKAGLLELKQLKAGNYLLLISSSDRTPATRIELKITNGTAVANALVGESRVLENRTRLPLAISETKTDDDRITLKLKNANESTRVHVFANRYQPAFDTFSQFSKIRDLEPWSLNPLVRRSVYVEGRQIGEEYQYILERKYARKFPGNMLTRPSLLLNPWATQTTDSRSQQAADGSDFAPSGNDGSEPIQRAGGNSRPADTDMDLANLDFLGDRSVLLENLRPDKNGTVVILRKLLGDNQLIRVVAVDRLSTIQRTIPMPLNEIKPRDLRLTEGLDSDAHFTQNKQIQILQPDETLTINDIVSARFQSYDNLEDIYQLLLTLSRNADLKQFEFILDWNRFDEKRKQSLYSEHACHELNFWLLKKDKPFFESVVLKHLANKRDRTFLDRWLLQDNLDEFVAPWHYARLNTFERILLSQKLESQSAEIIRNIHETYLLSPTKRNHFDRLYDMAMGGMSLESPEISERFDALRRKGSEGKLPPMPSDGQGSEMSLGRRLTGQPRVEMSNGQTGVRTENRTREVPVTRFRQEIRERTLPDGSSEKYTISVPYTEMVTQNYTVQVPASQPIGDFAAAAGDESDARRSASHQLYRRLPPTEQWIENSYWNLLPEKQTVDLVPINRFWRDYAAHTSGDFMSPYFPEAHHTFSEMMFVLAVLDLPAKGKPAKIVYNENQMRYTAAGPTIAFHQQVESAQVERGNTTILISENFFAANDRYRFEDDIRFDKFVTSNFHTHHLYGGQVAITNPTSTPRAVELLIQIPTGAVATNGSQETKATQFDLAAFSTQTFEYWFYFPTAGQFEHYPAHVSADERVLAVAEGVSFNVTDQPIELDNTSWAYVSQNGSDDEVIEFLNQQNILRIDLEKIAYRMSDKDFFNRTITTLRNRFVFNETLWAYSVKHNESSALTEFLTHVAPIADNCGPVFESKLLALNPVERNWYQHREYWPLVNARTHRLGPQRKILNPSFSRQYIELLTVLAYRKSLNNEDRLALTYYLLLQDRIEAALEQFAKTNRDELLSQIQYDYCDAYLDLYREQPDAAATKAEKWKNYPVDHWRLRFESILAQVAEIHDGKTEVANDRDQLQLQTKRAASSGSFDLRIEGSEIKITAQNLNEVTVNFYEMDIELLFSRSPFAQDNLDGFSLIRPNATQTISLKPWVADEEWAGESKEAAESKRALANFQLPESLRNKNVLVEVVSGGIVKSEPFFAHSLEVQLMENNGQLQVSKSTTRKPMAKTYVKVYARMADGSEQFHKDGYTDLRGRFDYVSQSNSTLDGIQIFSILILSEDCGAVIRQAKPPLE